MALFPNISRNCPPTTISVTAVFASPADESTEAISLLSPSPKAPNGDAEGPRQLTQTAQPHMEEPAGGVPDRRDEPGRPAEREDLGSDQGVVIDDTELFNDRLQEWEDFYNYNRPHGGLGGQTPYERLRQKTTSPV